MNGPKTVHSCTQKRRLRMHKYNDKEFYSVEEHDGIKFVHIHGYIYDAGEGIRRADETHRNVVLRNCYIPLSEFTGLNEDTLIRFMSTCEQSIEDMTKRDAESMMDGYYSRLIGIKQSAKELPFTELTRNTPCGEYVNHKAKDTEPGSMKAGDKFRLTGDITYMDKKCHVDSEGEVLVDEKPGERTLLCIVKCINGEYDVTAYVDVKDMLKVA